mmetsp:Transcript_23952/g.67983  ORF Transcript_23952/g.67983 Transcript_23952/m.67983 type:complete len:311 (-) Transcript_23952:1575-2507(-)
MCPTTLGRSRSTRRSTTRTAQPTATSRSWLGARSAMSTTSSASRWAFTSPARPPSSSSTRIAPSPRLGSSSRPLSRLSRRWRRLKWCRLRRSSSSPRSSRALRPCPRRRRSLSARPSARHIRPLRRSLRGSGPARPARTLLGCRRSRPSKSSNPDRACRRRATTTCAYALCPRTMTTALTQSRLLAQWATFPPNTAERHSSSTRTTKLASTSSRSSRTVPSARAPTLKSCAMRRRRQHCPRTTSMARKLSPRKTTTFVSASQALATSSSSTSSAQTPFASPAWSATSQRRTALPASTRTTTQGSPTASWR